MTGSILLSGGYRNTSYRRGDDRRLSLQALAGKLLEDRSAATGAGAVIGDGSGGGAEKFRRSRKFLAELAGAGADENGAKVHRLNGTADAPAVAHTVRIRAVVAPE